MADTKTHMLLRWQARLDTARQLRTDWEQAWRVEELERAFAGKLQEDLGAGAPFWVNLFFPTIQTQKPALVPRTLAWLVTPKPGMQPFDRFQAKMMEGVLSAIAAQDDHLFHDARLALHQAFFRLGVLKASYEPRLHENPQAGQPIQDAAGQPTGEREPDEVVTDEIYRWEWVDAATMLLPDQGPSQRKWTWIAEEITVPLDDAKHDERFSRRHRQALKANASAHPASPDGKTPPEPLSPAEEDEHAMLRYVEIWDMLAQRHYLWADGQDYGDEWLLDEPMPEGIEDHPYALLRFIPLLGPKPLGPSPWPIPLTFNWLPLQEQHDILAQMVINNARRAARKFGYQDDTFVDEEELDKFTSPVDMQGVRLSDVLRPPVPLGETSTNPDVANALLAVRTWWREETGASGTRVGAPDADTATEAVLVEQAANLRDNDMQLQVQKWLGRAGAKMLQLVRQTLTLDLYVEFRHFNAEELGAFVQQPAVQALLAARFGAENVGPLLQTLAMDSALQAWVVDHFGHIKPLSVTRSQLDFEADVEVLPASARPLQQTQLLRLLSLIGPVALSSPTLVEELLGSFDLPQGDRIAEELIAAVRQMQQMQQQQALMQQQTGSMRASGGMQSTRRGLRTNGPLSAVGGPLSA